MSGMIVTSDIVTGLLVQSDNMKLFERTPDNCIDLIITDPPFFTGRLQTAVEPRRNKEAGGGSFEAGATTASSITSFDDRWSGQDDYLDFMRRRLREAHRLLTPNGSLVVHLDYRAVYEIKIELDRIFGRDHFINEIIWHYTGGGRSKRYFSRKHDTLLWYGKGERWTFNIDAIRVPYKETSGYAQGGIVGRSGKRYTPHPDGTPVDDVWDIPMINPLANERCGYPTQKPLRLLERLVSGLSNEGDLLMDPFCGSGTTAVAASAMGRRWIACDESAKAIALTGKRLDADSQPYKTLIQDQAQRA